MNKILHVIFLVSLLGCTNQKKCAYKPPIDRKDGLLVSTLVEHKLDTAIFNTINKDICKGRYGNVHSLLVIADNELVVEQYYNGWEQDRLHFLASNTKSFNPLLMGVAIEKGLIKGVEEKMLSYFPEYPALAKDSLKCKIRLKDLLTMTSGFLWDEHSLPADDPNNMGNRMEREEDWLKSSLFLEMDTMPGTKYVYSGPNNIILSEILRKATGMTIAQYAEMQLFEPLGIKEYEWASKNGIVDSGGGLKLRPRDIAKYGLLHLNKGVWKGKTIVSEAWMEETFQPYIEIKHPFYGCYQWRMAQTEHGFKVWFIPGNGGQIINLIPALNMVVAVNADNRGKSLEDMTPLEHLLKNIIKIHPKLNKQITKYESI